MIDILADFNFFKYQVSVSKTYLASNGNVLLNREIDTHNYHTFVIESRKTS